MQLTVIGSGDAFGSGGRLQTCFRVETSDTEFLIDCGATAMIGFNGLGLDSNRISTIFITHLHGDHFAGLVWWMLHAEHVARRDLPLDVVGPPGIAERYRAAADALFPGSGARQHRFPLKFHEIGAGVPLAVNGVEVLAFTVSHPSGAPSHALRFTVDGKVIAYSGDTEWVEALTEVARDADLYITECFGYDVAVPYHMRWTGGEQSLERNLPRLTARHIMLTHMSNDMLRHAADLSSDRITVAEDGMILDV